MHIHTYGVLKNLLLKNAGFYHLFYREAWDKGPVEEPSHKPIITALLNHDLETALSKLEDDIANVRLNLLK